LIERATHQSEVRIAAVATAAPPARVTQSHARMLVRAHYADVLSERSMDVLDQILAHPSILTRHLAFDSELEVVGLIDEDPDRRMDRFTRWATELSREATTKGLADVGAALADIRGLFVNTCTGYICPGVSTYVHEALGLDGGVRVFDAVGSGCGGAIPNLDLAANAIRGSTDGVVVAVAVEVCTATYQMDNDMSLLVSNAIFGDGAAAAVLWTRPEGLRIVDSIGRVDTSYREDVRYVYKRGRLNNRLSVQLPRVVGEVVPPVIDELLARNGLSRRDVRHWAIHPGGEKMVVTLQAALGLDDAQMAPTRQVLAEYGNMSSPTVLFILRRIIDSGGIQPGDLVLMTAYGAGMSAYACLLEA
jgi:predicted naringenin-chalcone synthase